MVFMKYKKELMEVEQLIDEAISGQPLPITYDETLKSSIVFKLNKFIQMNQLKKDQLVDEKDMTNQLISDISHQTKTPIANLMLYSELLLEEASLSDGARALATEISTQSEKMKFLIHALIQSSRLEVGIVQVKPVKNNLHLMLEEVISQLESNASDKEIKIGYKKTDLEVVFDYKWTSEAIHNIIENAIKYTKTSGSINIDVEPYEMFYRINISDTGIGIKESEISQVFSRFYRSPEVSDIQGIGIGLHLAREIIEQQKGFIKVTSVPGRGSKFSVFLPLD